MTPERWKQIEELFHEALDLGDAERRHLLSKKADPALKREVEKLLDQFDDASSFIEQPLYDSDKGGVLSYLLSDAESDPMVGSILGSYRIEREVGRGGMGAVYEASRADGEFRLRVAIKVVKRGVDTDFVLRRFRNERQILAALDHPFITRLIDGGTTSDGRPYFVMEFVDGHALYRHCDKRRMSTRDRVQLFTRICEAVEYAHKKRVIHRDLKPSNIVVSEDGSPRLLDFGIAKLLDPDLASETLQPTATALRMMTVDYASPEQIRGEKVSYSTDVYSLGVILFELLTGHRPYHVKSRSPHDVARAICDEEPAMPSRVVGGIEDTPAVPVSPRAVTLTGLGDIGQSQVASNDLEGALDNIVLKCLFKDPAERYDRVEGLRVDLQRYLRGEAVVAQPREASDKHVFPDGAGQKLLAVLPLSLLSPGTAESTEEAYLNVGLADAIITRLTAVRQLTVRPTSSITRYNEQQVNPLRAGIELGVDFVLDGRIRRFGDRIRVSLQLLDVRGRSAIWAGQFDESFTDVLELEDAIAEQVAEALIPQLTGDEKEALAKRGTNVPAAYEAYLRGRFYWNQFTSQSLPKALEAFERAIELDPQYALAYVGVADFYIWANIYGLVPVRESYEHANRAARTALAKDDQLGEAYASLGLIVLNQFEFEKAEKLFGRAIELNPNYSLAHEWYSAMLIAVGRSADAVREIRRAEALDPLSLRAKTLVAWTYYQAGDLSKALTKADEIIALDPNYTQGHLQRGYVLSELERADEAVASIHHAMQLMPGSSLAEYHLAYALRASGDLTAAAEVAAAMAKRSESEYIKPMFLAFAHLAGGKMEEGFRYLQTAAAERDPWLAWLPTDPKFRSLHDDPRFVEILRSSGREIIKGRVVRTTANFESETTYTPDGITVAESEAPTLQFVGGLFRRHVLALAACGLLLIGFFAAYAAGFLKISLFNNANTIGNGSEDSLSSVAILPFRNATGSAAEDYIADGLTEDLISRLGTLTGVRTISRNAVFRYRSKQISPQDVGLELGVDAVLVGSVSRTDDNFTVKGDLIRVSTGKKLADMSFTDKAERIVDVQEAFTQRVLNEIDLRATGKTPVPKKSFTDNNEAFQSYLQGEFHRQKGTPADIEAAIKFYDRAIELDPNYALAFQGRALAYRQAPDFGYLAPKQAYPKAIESSQKALALDPSLGTSYVVLAAIKATYDWDFHGAEDEYKNAIERSPNNAEAHYSYGNFLTSMGRAQEALVEYRAAQQLDPLSQYIRLSVAWTMYIDGRFEEAAQEVRSVVASDPTFARAYLSLGEILVEQGKYEEAIAAIQKAREASADPLSDMALGHALAVGGRKDEARRIAVELENKVRKGEVSPFLPACVYAGLDEKDKAFYWLERAYQERSNWLTLIKVGRRLKSLRGDPRFDDLMKRVGFDV